MPEQLVRIRIEFTRLGIFQKICQTSWKETPVVGWVDLEIGGTMWTLNLENMIIKDSANIPPDNISTFFFSAVGTKLFNKLCDLCKSEGGWEIVE